MLAYNSKSYHQIFTTVYIFLFQTKVHVVFSELQPSSQCVCPLFPFEKLTQCPGYRHMRAHRSSHVIISPVESSPSCSRTCAGSRTANSRSACRLRDQCELVSDNLYKILLSLFGPSEPPHGFIGEGVVHTAASRSPPWSRALQHLNKTRAN